MTDRIDLLPLPEDYVDEGLWGKRYGPYSLEQMEDYARANVARAVEPLQAEIDALRTRLEDTVRDSTNKIEALRAERDALAQENELLRKDAERYRCLSAMATQQADYLGPIFRIDVRRSEPYLFNFDAAVDAAMQRTSGGDHD